MLAQSGRSKDTETDSGSDEYLLKRSERAQNTAPIGLTPPALHHTVYMAATPKHFAPLQEALDQYPQTVLSLRQLEELCARVGLDLYFEDQLFVWLMNELHTRDIRLADPEVTERPPASPGTAIQAGIREDIEEIVSLQESQENRLLNDTETIQLLQAVKEGMAAQERLAADPNTARAAELALLVQKKSEAETTLLTRNRGLVRRVCQQFQPLLNSMTMLDLEQEGNLGFLKAIHKFDLERTTKLSTYAVYWIRQTVQQAIANQDRTIRLPVHKRNEIRQYRVLVESLSERLGRDPNIREIALRLLAENEDTRDYEALFAGDMQAAGPIEREVLHRMEEHVKQIRSYIQQYPTSLDQFMEGEDVDRHELLTDENVLSPERQILKEDLIEDVDDWVSQLNEPEQSVMKLRFGFGNRRPLKYGEIALELNRNQAMVALNGNQKFTSYKVRNLESQARRTLIRWKNAEHFEADE